MNEVIRVNGERQKEETAKFFVERKSFERDDVNFGSTATLVLFLRNGL